MNHEIRETHEQNDRHLFVYFVYFVVKTVGQESIPLKSVGEEAIRRRHDGMLFFNRQPRSMIGGMNRKQSSRISRGEALAVWLLSMIVCCGSSLSGVYLAFDRRSLFLFAVSDGIEYGIGLGMFCTLIVASCACSAPLTIKMRIAAVVVVGIAIPGVIVGLWFFAVMEALSRV